MNLLNESISMQKIPHFDIMNYTQIKRLFESNNWNLTQKMDGFNISFGINEGKIFIKPKSGKSFTSLSELEILNKRLVYFTPFKKFYKILENSDFKKIYEKITDKEDIIFFGELLGSKRQNVVLYNENEIGNGTIVIFGIKQDNGSPTGIDITLEESGKIAINNICKYMTESDSDWNFIPSKPIDISMSNYNEPFKIIQKFIKENDDILKSKKQDCKFKLLKKLKMNELQSLIAKMKVNILEDLNKEVPYLGANKLEGAVIRNKDTGAISKIVDREYFTLLNKTSWYGRINASELSKTFVREIHSIVLKSTDIIWETKINTLINEYLSKKKNTKFKNLSELYKLLQLEFLQENELDNTVPEKLGKLSKEFYIKINKLFINVKQKQMTEDKIDEDNFKRTINHFVNEINELNLLISNIDEDTYGKCIWFCLTEKHKAFIKNKYIK